MHLPQGILGWTVFFTGLAIVAYRLHGIDAPRAWVEWVERQFIYEINLRFIGGILLLVALALGYYGGLHSGLIGNLFVLSVAIIGVTGLGLLLLQNHLRHIVFATGEASDNMIRYVSIGIVLLGMGIMFLPFLY